jgi:hypothetical protein
MVNTAHAASSLIGVKGSVINVIRLICCGWRFVYVLQPSHPQPSDSTSQKIVGKVGPGEGSTQNCPTDEGASEEFQHTGNHQYKCSNEPGLDIVQE